MPSTVIAGRYEIRDMIGRGAHAMVAEAYDPRLSRLVALKIVPRRSDEEGMELLSRFEQEARTVARLSHPGIVPVHDFGHGPDYAWLAMELVIGESLEDVLRRTPRLPVAEATRIVLELLDALAAAHRRGIVHRDVKPANILLAANEEDGLGQVKVTDFGVAHLPTQADGAELTTVGQMLGTPSTMAPEQVRGAAPDPRMDLWAAGVILFRALTGRRPFEGANLYATLHAVQAEEAPAPSSLVPELPAALDDVVARALRKDPADRFGSAEEMAAALRAAVVSYQGSKVLV
ncbi:serine/threonine-protein kinase [Muricoccus radiodurans]|uniref:serine/threonine-protein kinase n=1 Tax=Muricoccus radiodurans TaxID=2231721 RepID=UPI003CEDB732